MAQNTVKSVPAQKEEIPLEEKSGKGFFSFVDKYVSVGNAFDEGLPVQYMPKVLFFACIMMLYIANAHYGDKLVRKTNRLKNDVNDLRADYTTLKADLMFKSKQSEVAKQVDDIGLQESIEPPTKITEKNREY